MKIVILNSQGGAGKDTFYEYCKEWVSYVYHTSMVEGVKEIAEKNFGWRGGKEQKDRTLLMQIKDIWEEYNDGPFIDTCNRIRLIENELERYGLSSDAAVVFVDSRTPTDIQRFVDKYGATTVLLRRTEQEDKFTDRVDGDEVFDFKYDFIIDNNGSLEDLEQAAHTFMNFLLLN